MFIQKSCFEALCCNENINALRTVLDKIVDKKKQGIVGKQDMYKEGNQIVQICTNKTTHTHVDVVDNGLNLLIPLPPLH